MNAKGSDSGTGRVPISVWFLAATAFLAPYIGGNLNVEKSTLGPGIWTFLCSVFDGVDTPGFADLLVALGALACVVGLAVGRRVLQLPNSRIAAAVFALIGIITVSVVISSFKSVSVDAWSHWVAYSLVFFAATSAAGRVRGPVFVLGAFVGGCTLSAALAISEWGQYRSIDPTWRVFAVWNNPNALAGILVIGLIIGLALMVATDKLPSLAFGVASVAIGFALCLTQSRGGLLAAVIGVVGLFAAMLLSKSQPKKPAVMRFAAALGSVVLILALVSLSSRSGQGGLGSRLSVGSPATEQSTAFRKNLWRGGAKAIALHPAGTGIGTYNIYSAEAGLTTETQLAHNTPLQLAVEASVLAPAALVVLVVLWCVAVLRGNRPEPKAAVLRVGVVAAVLAAGVDGMFESNLYYFGTGVTVFLLMGLGLQLAADAVAPEFSPPVMRRSLAVGAVATLAFLGIFAYREMVKSNVRYDRVDKGIPDYSTLRAIADGDGEAHYLLGFDPALSSDARISEFKQAAQLEPSVKHLRLLADAYAQTGNKTATDPAFRDALAIDPNNLETLTRLMEFDRNSGHQEDAIETARRLVDVESKPYFKVRALSEIVPLQTADARVFLASQTTDRRLAADQLERAAILYLKYAQLTVPYLRKAWHDVQTDMPIAGETQAGLVSKLQQGVELAKSAAIADRNLGLTGNAAEASAEATVIQSVLDDFTRALAASK